MREIRPRIGFRETLVGFSMIVASILAIVDRDFRQLYGQLLLVIIGGYFGQLLPKKDL